MPAFRRLLGTACVLVICGWAIASARPALALTGSTEASFTKALMGSCIKEMKASQGKDPLPDAKINGYCSCVAMQTAKELNDNELSTYIKTAGKGTVHMQTMNARIARECTKRYLQK